MLLASIHICTLIPFTAVLVELLSSTFYPIARGNSRSNIHPYILEDTFADKTLDNSLAMKAVLEEVLVPEVVLVLLQRVVVEEG